MFSRRQTSRNQALYLAFNASPQSYVALVSSFAEVEKIISVTLL
jgi:hypothetical protein